MSVSNTTGCSRESAVMNVLKTDVPVLQAADFTCKVFPNPNNGMFTIELESDQSKKLELELFTADGKSVLKKTVEHLSGKHQILFGQATLADGIYNLQIKYGTNILTHRIIVN